MHCSAFNSPIVFRRVVEKAFSLWSEQISIPSLRTVKLDFQEADDPSDADITIMWAEGAVFLPKNSCGNEIGTCCISSAKSLTDF